MAKRRKQSGAKSKKKKRITKYARPIKAGSKGVTVRNIGPSGIKPSSVPNNSVVTVPRGFPTELRTSLVYTDLQDIVSAASPSFYASARFSMNDPTDPDVTGTGAQPPMFDNMRQVYTAWRVNSCKVTVDMENYTNVPCYITLVGLYDGTSNPSLIANPATYDLLGLPTTVRSSRKRLSTINAAPGNVKSLSKTFYPADLVGQDYFTSVNFQGGASSGPAKVAFIDIVVQSGSSLASSEIGCWLSWRVEYDISFFDESPAELAAYD